MSPTTLPDAEAFRHADAAALAAVWATSRARLLELFAAWRAGLPANLEIRYAPELNPPLWELGHIGWFEEYWIARNPQRLRGTAADPDSARAAPLRREADAFYHSSRVAHTQRWQLALPDAARTLDDLARVHERTRALLAQAGSGDDALYFFRLALLHEEMHREAWAYMAQHLALDVGAALARTGPQAAVEAAAGELSIGGQAFRLGRAGGGFSFDNECGVHELELAPYAIDAAPVSWARFLPFVEAGGYDDDALWSTEGWAWRQRGSKGRPRYLQRDDDGAWQRAVFGRWEALDPAQPAVHLSRHEAEAWCRWAGRRLPTEAEWECAALTQGPAFAWGEVWEWTASPFAPYPGFAPHPYRDYSQPWFDGRPVLRGASFATAAHMKHPRYRNYFEADRNDIFAGFRSCAAGPEGISPAPAR